MRYEAVSVYDMSEVMGTLVTDDNGVVISFEPAEDSREDLFDEEIESGETIQRVAGHWRMTAFLDEDGTPVSSLPLSGDDEGDRRRGRQVRRFSALMRRAGVSADEVELTGTGVISKADEERRIV